MTNAGYSDIVSIEDADLAAMHAVMETNLWGVVNVVKAARVAAVRSPARRVCPDAFDDRGLPVIHLARVIGYDVPQEVISRPRDPRLRGLSGGSRCRRRTECGPGTCPSPRP